MTSGNLAVFSRAVFLALTIVAAPASGAGPRAGAAGKALAPGTVLDETTAPLAAGLLPPELLAHYRKGEYRNKIADWPVGRGTMGPEFEAQTRRNAEVLTVDAEGTIVDKKTGRQPPFVYGVPFPKIDPADPTAGIKVVWNQFYAYWWNGNNRTLIDLVWLQPGEVDRKVTQDVYFKYYDGIPPDLRPPHNPDNLSPQFLSTTRWPADLNGTTALTWRYRDARKRDSVWAYVPALRRVRAVSPSNRSDGFLGSDMSQDDGPFFDGKPEDFTWKLAGQREVLRLVDPFRLRGEHRTEMISGGGCRSVLAEVPLYGFEKPEWSGLAWAPIAMELARRRAWVVEGVPKDAHYLYGKIQLWIDAENWHGMYNRKFSWRGELLNTGQVHSSPAAKDCGKYYTFKSPSVIAQIAENVKANRATVVSFGEDRHRRLVAYHIPLTAQFFDQTALARFGK